MNKKTIKDMVRTGKFKYGTIAVVVTVCAIIITIILNMVLSALNDKFNLQFDMTKNNFYGMSQTTKDYIASLDKHVDIMVLNSKDNFKNSDDKYYTQASSVIDQYAQNSSNISVEYLELVKNPNIASQYSQDKVKDNDVIVKSGDKYKHLTASDLFEQSVNYQTYSYVITSSKAEQAVTSAILNVTSDSKVKIELLVGYNEVDQSDLTKLLTDNNFDVSETKILTSDIADTTNVVVIYGPSLDYDAETIEKLDKYMNRGTSNDRTLFYIASPDAPATPNLNSFLNKWGITVGDGNVFETNYSNLYSPNSPYCVVAQYNNDEYTQKLNTRDIPVAMPASKPVDIKPTDSTEIIRLLESSSESGICPADADENWKITQENITGPLTLACIATKNINDAKSNVCVIGSSQAFDTSFTSRSSVNNASYFVNVFNKLSNKDNSIVIEPKSVQNSILGINPSQSLIFTIIFVFVLPVAFIVIGIVTWLRRRHS